MPAFPTFSSSARIERKSALLSFFFLLPFWGASLGAQGFNVLFDTLGGSRIGAVKMTPKGGAVVAGTVHEEAEGRGPDKEHLFFSRFSPKGKLQKSRSFSGIGRGRDIFALGVPRRADGGYTIVALQERRDIAKLIFLKLDRKGKLLEAKSFHQAFHYEDRQRSKGQLVQSEDRLYFVHKPGTKRRGRPDDQGYRCFVFDLEGNPIRNFQLPVQSEGIKVKQGRHGLTLISGEERGPHRSSATLHPKIHHLDSTGKVLGEKTLKLEQKEKGRREWRISTDPNGMTVLTRGNPQEKRFRITKSRRKALKEKARERIREKLKARQQKGKDPRRSKNPSIEKRVRERMEQWEEKHGDALEKGVLLVETEILLVRKDPKGNTLWKKRLVLPKFRADEDGDVWKGELDPMGWNPTRNREYFRASRRIDKLRLINDPKGDLFLAAKYLPSPSENHESARLLIARIGRKGKLRWSRSYPIKGNRGEFTTRFGRGSPQKFLWGDIRDDELLLKGKVDYEAPKRRGDREVNQLIKVGANHEMGCSSSSLDLRLEKIQKNPFRIEHEAPSFSKDASGFTQQQEPDLKTQAISAKCDSLSVKAEIDHLFEADEGRIEVNGQYGTEPYTFEWGDGSESKVREGLDTGAYSVKVTDSEGCTERDTFQVLDRYGFQQKFRLSGKGTPIWPKDLLVTEGGTYITGGLGPTQKRSERFFLSRMDSLGNILWTRTYEPWVAEREKRLPLHFKGQAPSFHAIGLELKKGPDGSIAIAGKSRPTIDGSAYMGRPFLAMVTEKGDAKWIRWGKGTGKARLTKIKERHRREEKRIGRDMGLARTSSGHYVLTGTVRRDRKRTLPYIAKYGPKGKTIWTKTLDVGNSAKAQDVAVTPNGRIHVLGRYQEKASGEEREGAMRAVPRGGEKGSFLSSFSPKGELLKSQKIKIGESGEPWKNSRKLISTPQGELFATGFARTETDHDSRAMVLLKFDAEGKLQDQYQYFHPEMKMGSWITLAPDGKSVSIGGLVKNLEGLNTNLQALPTFSLELTDNGDIQKAKVLGRTVKGHEEVREMDYDRIESSDEAFFLLGQQPVHMDRQEIRRRSRGKGEVPMHWGYLARIPKEYRSNSFMNRSFDPQSADLKVKTASVSDTLGSRAVSESLQLIPQKDHMLIEPIEHPACDIEKLDLVRNGTNAKVQVKGTGGKHQVQWSHGPQKAKVENLDPGRYTVKVSDRKGCSQKLGLSIPLTNAYDNMRFPEDQGSLKKSNTLEGDLYLALSRGDSIKVMEMAPNGQTDRGYSLTSKAHEFDGLSVFRSGKKGHLVGGSTEHGAYLLSLDPKGQPQWARSYTNKKRKLTPLKAYQAPGGDFLILGISSEKMDKGANKNIRRRVMDRRSQGPLSLMRVGPDGELKEQRRIHKDGSVTFAYDKKKDRLYLARLEEKEDRKKLLWVHIYKPGEGFQKSRSYALKGAKVNLEEVREMRIVPGKGPLIGLSSTISFGNYYLLQLQKDLTGTHWARSFAHKGLKSGIEEIASNSQGRTIIGAGFEDGKTQNMEYVSCLMELGKKGEPIRTRGVRPAQKRKGPRLFDEMGILNMEFLNDSSLCFTYRKEDEPKNHWVRTEADLFDRCALGSSVPVNSTPFSVEVLDEKASLSAKDRGGTSSGTFEVGSRSSTIQAHRYCASPCPSLRTEVDSVQGSNPIEDKGGRIALEAKGGTAPYRFSWSTGDSGKVLKDLASGVYKVRVEDDKGCRTSRSFKVPTEIPEQKWMSDLELFGSRMEKNGASVLCGRYGKIGRDQKNTRHALMKLGPNGDLRWKRAYGKKDSNEVTYDMTTTPEGGFMLCGASVLGEGKDEDISLLRTGPKGKLKGYWNIEAPEIEKGYAIERTSDGNYVIAGRTKDPSSEKGDADAYIAKVSKTGSLLWSKSLDGNGKDIFNDLLVDDEGRIYGVGNTQTGGKYDGTGHLLIASFSPSGKTHWAKQYEGKGWSKWTTVTMVDGSILVAHQLKKPDGAGLMAIGPEGDAKWSYRYPIETRLVRYFKVHFHNIVPTDEGIKVLGTLNGDGNDLGLILALDPEKGVEKLRAYSPGRMQRGENKSLKLLNMKEREDGTWNIIGRNQGSSWKVYYGRSLPEGRMGCSSLQDLSGERKPYALKGKPLDAIEKRSPSTAELPLKEHSIPISESILDCW